MSLTPQLLRIEKSLDEVRETVLLNICKMLQERKLIDSAIQVAKKLFSTKSDENIYRVKTNSEDYIIKILSLKISGLNKTSPLGEFLIANSTVPKIIIVQDINNRTRELALQNYPNTEIFLERDFMINIIDHVSVPRHVLLSKEESKRLIKDYDIKKKEMLRILHDDPIARYYKASPGQVFEVYRPSATGIVSVVPRLVVKGKFGDK